MADTIQAALAAAGLTEPTTATPRKQRESRAPRIPKRRERSRELPPTLRLELKAALSRKDLSGVVWISDHAVQRFRERFEPESAIEDARFTLTARLNRRARWHSCRPRWVSLERGDGTGRLLENVGYLLEGDGEDEIVLPLALSQDKPTPLSAVTCLYPTPPPGD